MTRIRIGGRDFAVTAAFVGIVGFFTLGIAGPPAIILGVIALRTASRSGEPSGIRGMAWFAIAAGAVSGLLGIANLSPGFHVQSIWTLSSDRLASEARAELASIRLAQEAYLIKHGTYCGDLSSLGTDHGVSTNYRYSIEEAAGDDFLIAATGKAQSPAEGEIWRLKVIDGIARKPSRHRTGKTGVIGRDGTD
ncbi:hypothetical protein ACFL4G_00785 [Thermodesulfobacteriota bacterium]